MPPPPTPTPPTHPPTPPLPLPTHQQRAPNWTGLPTGPPWQLGGGDASIFVASGGGRTAGQVLPQGSRRRPVAAALRFRLRPAAAHHRAVREHRARGIVSVSAARAPPRAPTLRRARWCSSMIDANELEPLRCQVQLRAGGRGSRGCGGRSGRGRGPRDLILCHHHSRRWCGASAAGASPAAAAAADSAK